MNAITSIKLNKKASSTRSNLIKEEFENFNILFDTEEKMKTIIQGTLFENFLNSSALSIDSIKAFAFSAFITKKLVKKYLTKINSLESYYYVSKIIEQGYFKLPSDTTKTNLKNNLAVSKEYGIFYTPIKIAREMALDVLEASKSKIVIDPCCGTGNLLAACLEQAKKNDKSLKKLIGIEIDPLAANICREGLKKLSESLGLNVEIEIIVSNSLDLLGNKKDISSKDLPLGSIIINPPYGKLKVEKSITTNKETMLNYLDSHINKKKEINKLSIDKITRILGSKCKVTEWSNVFLELCANEVPKDEVLVYLGPCGWLNSKAQSSFREELIVKNKLHKIHFISEANTGFETVNQPLAIINITSNSSCNEIQVFNDNIRSKNILTNSLTSLKDFGYPIPRINGEEIQLYIKLQKLEKFSEIKSISNLRGELDQSINKSVISSTPSQIRIIRGENIGRYSEVDIDSSRVFFADINEFNKQLSFKPKGSAYKKQRIIGRQCSYMKQERRLIFCIIPENCVVGNSCNYIAAPNSELLFILSLLNSSLFDWYFRVLNGNNHVANYEIDNFPYPKITDVQKNEITNEANYLMNTNSYNSCSTSTKYFNNEAKIDSLIFKAFNIANSDVELILNRNSSTEYLSTVLSYLK